MRKNNTRCDRIVSNAATLQVTVGGGSLMIYLHEHRQLHQLKRFKDFCWTLAIYAEAIGSRLRVDTVVHIQTGTVQSIYEIHYASSCVILAQLMPARCSANSLASYWQSSKRTLQWSCLHLPYCSLCQPFYHPPLTQILPSVWCVLSFTE